MASQIRLEGRQSEEVMSEVAAASSSAPSKSKQLQTSNSTGNHTYKPLLPVPVSCYPSLDSCVADTQNCTGNGLCYKKYGTEGKQACFACGCTARNETFSWGEKGSRRGSRLTYYGGGACQKQDVSGPFWLIVTFTVVMVGLIGWAIGMLYSIGEEPLPGVIGAGVSNKVR